MKKMLACLLCLSLLLGMAVCGMTAEAAENIPIEPVGDSVGKSHTEDTTTVRSNGSCGDNAYYELHSNGILYIYGTGDMKEYTDFETPFFDIEIFCWSLYSFNMTEVIIEPGITSIGRKSFSGCRNITKVTLPEGITKIGDSAFSGCLGLTSIEIPHSVTKIEDKAFFHCDNITDVYFDGTENEWLNATSENNDESLSTAMKHYKENDDTPYVVDYGTDDYQPITLYDSTDKNNGENSYQGIKYCFYKDYAEIAEVDNDLYSSYYPEYAKNKIFAFPKEVVFTETGKVLPVTKISGDYYKLTANKVIIPNSVTDLKARFGNEFENNKALREVVFEEGSKITTLPNYAFAYCTNLKRVASAHTNQMPDSITEIGVGSFENCTSLENITLPKNLISMQGETFKNCIILSEISFPPTLEIIGDYSFSNCTSLSKVEFELFQDGINKGKCSLKEMRDGFTSYKKTTGMFSDCINLKKIDLPMSINEYNIPSFCFANTGLSSINIPPCVKSIGGCAFYNVNFKNNLNTDEGKEYAIGIFNRDCVISDRVGIDNANMFGYKRDDFLYQNITEPYEGVSIDERPTIAGYTNSKANDFANKNGFHFVDFGSWNPYVTRIPGDVNGDGKINTRDIMTIKLYLCGWNVENDISILDVNGDGKVNLRDAMHIQLYLNGWNVTLY